MENPDPIHPQINIQQPPNMKEALSLVNQLQQRVNEL